MSRCQNCDVLGHQESNAMAIKSSAHKDVSFMDAFKD